MNQIEEIKAEIKNRELMVSRAKMANKLFLNRDFKELILKDFIVEEAARLVALSADPILGPNERADALAMAQAAGHLKRYLSVVCQMGSVAERDIEDMNEALLEMEAEEDAQ